MVDLGALAKRAQRAAEWGRLRSASRIAAVVVPFSATAMLISPHRTAVFAIGLVLLAVTIALGWHKSEGGRAARSGLKLGAIPMTAALFTTAAEGWCGSDRAVTLCGAGCLLAGLAAGGASAWYAVRTKAPQCFRIWSQVGLVASLTTALGCIGLGFGGALTVLAAMAAGAAVAWVPARTRI